MKFHLLKQAVIGPEVPMAVFENIYNTRDNDLKVILYALQNGEANPMDIARKLDISLAAVQSSLLFWADKGIVLMEEESNEKPKKKKLLSASEILKISQSNPEIEVLVNQLQKIYGHAINEKGTNAFLSLYLENGVPVDVILVLTMYLAPVSKGPAYTAKIILNLFEKKGITSADKAEEYITVAQRREKAYDEVCSIFSLDKTKLTSSEKTIIDSWYERLEMSSDMIKSGFEASVGKDNIIRYCNGVLKSWSQKGYKTPADIQQGLGFITPSGKNIDDDNDFIMQGMNIVPVFNKGE